MAPKLLSTPRSSRIGVPSSDCGTVTWVLPGTSRRGALATAKGAPTVWGLGDPGSGALGGELAGAQSCGGHLAIVHDLLDVVLGDGHGVEQHGGNLAVALGV